MLLESHTYSDVIANEAELASLALNDYYSETA